MGMWPSAFDKAQISMTIKWVSAASCASPRVTCVKNGEQKNALILDTDKLCQANPHTRIPAYPFTRSLLTLNLKFTARHSYISRRQTRPRLESGRGRELKMHLHISSGRRASVCVCVWVGSECIRPGSLAFSQVLQTGISIADKPAHDIYLSIFICLVESADLSYKNICHATRWTGLPTYLLYSIYCQPFDECAIKYYAAGLEY